MDRFQYSVALDSEVLRSDKAHRISLSRIRAKLLELQDEAVELIGGEVAVSASYTMLI